jgi:hypothetical protein
MVSRKILLPSSFNTKRIIYLVATRTTSMWSDSRRDTWIGSKMLTDQIKTPGFQLRNFKENQQINSTLA